MKRFCEVWFGKFITGQYRTKREVIRVIDTKTPGLYQVPKMRYAQKSLIRRGFVMFGLVNLSADNKELSGRPNGLPRENPRSLSSPKAEICPKITNLERFCEVWFGKFISRQ